MLIRYILPIAAGAVMITLPLFLSTSEWFFSSPEAIRSASESSEGVSQEAINVTDQAISMLLTLCLSLFVGAGAGVKYWTDSRRHPSLFAIALSFVLVLALVFSILSGYRARIAVLELVSVDAFNPIDVADEIAAQASTLYLAFSIFVVLAAHMFAIPSEVRNRNEGG